MRDFAQPKVLKLSLVAALATAALCYPRLALWLKRADPMWFLEATIFLGATVLWGFVFAWHTRYTQRPVLTLKLEPKPLLAATLAGLVASVGMHYFIDASLQKQLPEDYPSDIKHWLAMTCFTLAFSQLFLVFAPFAWLMRLTKNPNIAICLTVLWGLFVMVMKIRNSQLPSSTALVPGLLAARVVLGAASVIFYARGGLLLAWWFMLLLEVRHLFDFGMGL